MSDLHEGPRRSRALAWGLAVAATLTMSVSYFDRHTLAVIAKEVTTDLSIGEKEYGYVVSAFSLAYLVGSPLAGRVIDRFGARVVLPLAVVAWTAVAASQAAVGSLLGLILLRIALGLAESPSFPGAAQTVTRALPASDRARGFGLLFTGSSLGAFVAAFVAPSLVEHRGWRWAFGLSAAAGLVWIPMWLIVTGGRAAREILDHKPPPAEGTTEPKPSLLSTLKSPGVARAVVLVIATSPVANFVLNWTAKLLGALYGMGPGDLKKYAWIPPVLFDVGSLAFGFLAARALGSPRAQRALFVAGAAAAATLPLAVFVGHPIATAVFAGIAIGGVGGLFAMLTADMLGRVRRSEVSAAGGITAAAQSLAYIVSGPLIGYSIDATGRYTLASIALAFFAPLGVVLWFVLEPRMRADPIRVIQ